MIQIDFEVSPEKLRPKLERLFELSAAKIRAIEKSWDPAGGPPVVTVKGSYQPRDWTDWTRGFQYGSALLQFDATGEAWFLERGREGTRKWMEGYTTHTGVHDHGFNVVSTFGNSGPAGLRGQNPGNTAGAGLLPAGAQSQRRHPGGPLVAHFRRRRIHLLFQRRAFAFCGYHPLAAFAGRCSPAWLRSARGIGPQSVARRTPGPARRSHRAVFGLLRRRPRPL